jgi:hypothetical protein
MDKLVQRAARNGGKTPMRTFLDAMPLAKEKMTAAQIGFRLIHVIRRCH